MALYPIVISLFTYLWWYKYVGIYIPTYLKINDKNVVK